MVEWLFGRLGFERLLVGGAPAEGEATRDVPRGAREESNDEREDWEGDSGGRMRWVRRVRRSSVSVLLFC